MRLFACCFFLVIFSCQSDYQKQEKQELSKGIRHDDLFEGLQLGMTRKAFFDTCLIRNHQMIFKDGLLGKVHYKIKGLSNPASFYFYPDFKDEKIHQFPVIANYDTWAPWNRGAQSDKLHEELLLLLMKWYEGNPFKKIEAAGKPVIWVKLDGNRRIVLSIRNESQVSIIYKDILVSDDEN